MRQGSAIVLYDRDCGWCRWTLAKLLAWDRDARLRPVALQDGESDRLLADMAPAERMASWHLVRPDGRRFSAGAAFPPLLALLPGGTPLARIAQALPQATECGYGWVAKHRSPLGRRLRRSWIERADERISARAAADARPAAGARRSGS